MTASSTNANHASEFGGKRVLVTGGTKGAGKAIASRFLQGGATVVITARSGPAEKTAAHFIQADLSTSEGTAHVIDEMLSRFKARTSLSIMSAVHRRRAADLSPSPTNSGNRPSTRTYIRPSGWTAACFRR